jgi:hypothetical protein
MNPASELQCSPDALDLCDYSEILGTDGGKEGQRTGFVTVQILSLPGKPWEALCLQGGGGLASCRLGLQLPRKNWRSERDWSWGEGGYGSSMVNVVIPAGDSICLSSA